MTIERKSAKVSRFFMIEVVCDVDYDEDEEWQYSDLDESVQDSAVEFGKEIERQAAVYYNLDVGIRVIISNNSTSR